MPYFHFLSQAHDFNYNHVKAEGGGGGYLYRNSAVPLEWESFVLWTASPPRGANACALQAWNGQFVCAENGGGAHLIANRPSIAGWETFTLRHAGSPGSTAEIRNGNLIALQAANGQYVSGPTANGIMYANAGGIGATERFQIWSQGNQPRSGYWGWRDLPAILA